MTKFKRSMLRFLYVVLYVGSIVFAGLFGYQIAMAIFGKASLIILFTALASSLIFGVMAYNTKYVLANTKIEHEGYYTLEVWDFATMVNPIIDSMTKENEKEKAAELLDLIDEIRNSKYIFTFTTVIVMSYYIVGCEEMKMEGEEDGVFCG